jgi:hypothetical protein
MLSIDYQQASPTLLRQSLFPMDYTFTMEQLLSVHTGPMPQVGVRA